MVNFIKDADCTKDTPVVYGWQERPIYGRQVRFRPRVPGKRKTATDKKSYLPRLLPLENYDLIIVLFSGGKDSLAAYLNREAAKANHMSYQTVLDRCNGKVKNPYALDGFTYRFEDAGPGRKKTVTE